MQIFVHPIPGFPGYAISRSGRVYSTKYRNGRGGARRNTWLTARPHPRTGHLRVDLRDATGRKRTVQVQRLVAWAFLGPQPPDTLVCHSNGDETDNEPGNLYYGTPTDNARDRERHKQETHLRDDVGLIYKPDAELGF